ncbi:MAG: hypothetical protein ABSG53_11705 [Thermoguttaceae bacterium]|jgi:tetratricopeptide (TPR) repeat protein
MKSERRHELQHNDLAEWILKAYERIVPYKNALFGVGLLLVVLFIGLSLWHSHSVSQAGEAWNSLGVPVFQPVFVAEQTISLMDQSAKTYQGDPAAEWAEVFAGDTALMVGTNRILTDKKIGIEYLNDAQKRYTEALKTLTIAGAKEQAMFGKARAMESMSQNKAQVDEAVAAYKELIERFPNGMFKPVADQRIEQLQKKDALEFYRALAQYAPKPKVESPRSKLDNLGPLPENPTDEPLVPKTPVRGEGSQSGPIQGIPAPSLTPTEPVKVVAPKTEIPMTQPVKPQVAKPDAPKLESVTPDTPKPEAPKSEASKPDVPKKDK